MTYGGANFAGVYWGPRAASAENSASRLLRTLQTLSATVESQLAWQYGVSGLIDGSATLAQLTSVFDDGKNYSERVGREWLRELGYVVNMVAYLHGQPITLGVTSGADAPGVPNCAVLSPLPAGWNAGDVLQCLVDSWEPDWGAVTRREVGLLAASAAPKLPVRVGQFMYVGPKLRIDERVDLSPATLIRGRNGVWLHIGEEAFGLLMAGEAVGLGEFAIRLQAAISRS